MPATSTSLYLLSAFVCISIAVGEFSLNSSSTSISKDLANVNKTVLSVIVSVPSVSSVGIFSVPSVSSVGIVSVPSVSSVDVVSGPIVYFTSQVALFAISLFPHGMPVSVGSLMIKSSFLIKMEVPSIVV